ncbi:MAG: ABC transporter permease [Lachnospiraceae bacterium]|nr:ABC transporter permease [Lachnospiraceae bacterium]
MQTVFQKALELIMSGDRELCNILLVTAKMSLTSSLISLLIGVPVGLWLGTCKFPGNSVLVIINRTLMGMPPVVCGLLFYILFSGVGPFRRFALLFTVKIMILAQIVLITPLVISSVEAHVSSIAPDLQETTRGLGLPPLVKLRLLINESMYNILTTYLLAFARAVAEVGAVAMVGGAIAWKTNVMTTAIMMYTNRGNFSLGMALGIILIGCSLIVNTVISVAQRRLTR